MNATIIYPKTIRWSEIDQCFIGSIPDLCGDCCHGRTEGAVLKQLEKIEADWLEIFASDKRELPPISTVPLAKKKKAKDIRVALAMNQTQFAAMLSISVKTLHKWEQGTSKPSGAARTLLDLVATHPEIILMNR
jgi:DNA-binding transcriptional regulator YiaG